MVIFDKKLLKEGVGLTKSFLKNTFREIKNSKARFVSIMAIIALGAGFFAGIKATVPSMYNLAETYFKEQNLMDFQIVSTAGFDEDDINAVSNLKGVTSVMPSYSCDVQTAAENGGNVLRLIALPAQYKNNCILNELVLKEGRLPQKKGELAADAGSFKKGGYRIGDKVRLSEFSGDTDTSTLINCMEYTIVGKVQSPLYISYQRGTTTIGNGKISDYAYIMSENFEFDRYTELYVKTDISDRYTAFSDEYNTEIGEIKETIKNTAAKRCSIFNTDVILKAKNELQDAKDKYKEEKNKADIQLKNAEKELISGRNEYKTKIAEAQRQLDTAGAQLESVKSELDKAADEYYYGIEYAEKLTEQKEAELGAARKKYNSSREEYDIEIKTAQKLLDDGWEEYNSAVSEFKTNTEPQLLLGIEQTQAAVSRIENIIEQTSDPAAIAVLKQQLEQTQATLDKLNSQYSQALDALDENKALLDEKQQTFDDKKAQGQKQLDNALAQLQYGDEQLAAAKSELKIKKTEGFNQLSEAQQQINSAQKEYDSGIKELEKQKKDGKKRIDDAQQEYDSKKNEVNRKFEDAKREIDDAQKKTDALSFPKWYEFSREDNPGFVTFSQNADRLNAVASVFPLFFLLVAVLVCVTTMTRLIEEKRTEIGTFKALGYSSVSIIMKFVIYSLIAAVTGGIIGVFIGIFTIPFIIYNAYKIMYFIGDIILIPDFISIFLGIAAAAVCTVAVSTIVCMRSLSHKPASIMRPKAPKPGKRIILERIKPIWEKFSFNSKLTARNLLRYKSRLCMTIIGIAGCTALIVAAFGLLNSFDPLVNDQFETIYKYNAVVIPKEGGTEEELMYLTDKIRNTQNIDSSMLVAQEKCTVKFNGNIKDADTYLTVIQHPDELSQLISLHTRKNNEELPITNEGVLINEKLAEEFGIKKGDIISLGTDSGNTQAIVCGIYEQYMHNYIYMSPSLYTKLYSKDVIYNMLDVKLAETSVEAENVFSAELLKNKNIAAVNYINSSLDDFKNMLDSLNMVVMVMIICAASLAFVVLYNLTNINIAERVREIATFKVLGFNHKETSSFIYRENIILTVLGIIVGLFLGILLTGFIVQTVEIDNIMFGRDIYFTSFLYASGLTFMFSLLVNAVMSFKIKAVNMVESLKSVE